MSLRHARNAFRYHLLVYWSHLSRRDIPAHFSLAARNTFRVSRIFLTGRCQKVKRFSRNFLSFTQPFVALQLGRFYLSPEISCKCRSWNSNARFTSVQFIPTFRSRRRARDLNRGFKDVLIIQSLKLLEYYHSEISLFNIESLFSNTDSIFTL